MTKVQLQNTEGIGIRWDVMEYIYIICVYIYRGVDHDKLANQHVYTFTFPFEVLSDRCTLVSMENASASRANGQWTNLADIPPDLPGQTVGTLKLE